MTQRLMSMRRPGLFVGLLVLLMASATVVARAVSADSDRASAAANLCDRVPAAKCAAIHAASTPPPSIVSPEVSTSSQAITSGGLTPSPVTVACGPTFFASDTASALTAHFGSVTCFRFSGGLTWVVVGSGEPLTGTGIAPGGEMIATDTCGATDAACQDADTQHAFAAFTVHYPPDPDTAPGEVQTSFGGRLLYFSDAYCGLLVFDLQSDDWYPNGSEMSLLNGNPPSPVAVPLSIGGTNALTAPAPGATGSCE